MLIVVQFRVVENKISLYMKFFDKPYKNLLILAVIFYCQFLFFQIVLTPTLSADFIYGTNKLYPLGIYFLIALIFAPLYEEFIYRGLFIKSKWRYLSYTLFIVGSFIVFYFIGYGFWALLLSSFGVFFIFLKEKNDFKFRNLLIAYSILIFAISHYKPENLMQIETFSTIGNFLAAGCLLTWVVFNYSLLASILVHASLNLIMFSIFLFGLYNVDPSSKKNCFPKINLCYKLQEKAISFTNISKLSRKTDSLIVKNGSIPDILKILNIQDTLKIGIYEPYKKIDLIIYKNSGEISVGGILQVMEKLKLIQIQKH